MVACFALTIIWKRFVLTVPIELAWSQIRCRFSIVRRSRTEWLDFVRKLPLRLQSTANCHCKLPQIDMRIAVIFGYLVATFGLRVASVLVLNKINWEGWLFLESKGSKSTWRGQVLFLDLGAWQNKCYKFSSLMCPAMGPAWNLLT